MQYAIKYVTVLVILAVLLKFGTSQSQFAVPIAVRTSGLIGGGAVISNLVAIAVIIFLLRSLDEKTDEACDALFADSDVTKEKEMALDDCKGCTGRSEEDCEDNSNCAFSDGTCFIRGDSSVPALFCSFIVSDPDELATCQKCWGLPEAECIEDEPNTDCNFVKDRQICVPDIDDFTALGGI